MPGGRSAYAKYCPVGESAKTGMLAAPFGAVEKLCVGPPLPEIGAVLLFVALADAVGVRDLLAEAEAEAEADFDAVAVAVAQSVAPPPVGADPPAGSVAVAEGDPEAVVEEPGVVGVAVAEAVDESVLEAEADAVADAEPAPVPVPVAVADADMDAVEPAQDVAEDPDAAAAGNASTVPYSSVPAPADSAITVVSRRGLVKAAAAFVVS